MRYPQFWRLPEEIMEMIFEQLRIDEAASRIGASIRGLLRRLKMEPFRGSRPRERIRRPFLFTVSRRRARVNSALMRYRDPVEWALMGE